MRVAYGKICRSIPLTLAEASNVGGDSEVVTLLNELLKRGHEVHLISKNRGDVGVSQPFGPSTGELHNHFAPGELFGNPPQWARHAGPEFDTYAAYYRNNVARLPQFDATFMWLGDHGTSNHPMPGVAKATLGKYTTARQQDVIYGYPPLAILNELGEARGDRPHWLCPDPRNMIKFRDLWHPNQRPVLAQFNTSKESSFYSEVDDRVRKNAVRYNYSGIEMLALPRVGRNFAERIARPETRGLFGLLVNEGYNNLPTGKGRKDLVRRWCDPSTSIVGTWSEDSINLLKDAGFNEPRPVALADVEMQLMRWKATMTFPATNSGWATAKPWECFASGTVCFRHPDYDTQNHIYGEGMRKYTVEGTPLDQFLSPRTRQGLEDRLKTLENDEVYFTAAHAQAQYMDDSWKRLDGGFAAVQEVLSGRQG